MELSAPAYGRWLAKEKRRDYRNAVLVQVLMMGSELLLEDTMQLVGWPLSLGFLKFFFYALSGIYLLLLWDMLRNFTLRRWLTHGVLGTLIVAFCSLFMVDVVLGGGEHQHAQLRFVCHFAFLLVQVVVIGFALRDLFQGSRRDEDKLWGSACLFFMSGFAFAGLFFCVLIKDPLAFGQPLPDTHWGLFEALYLSMTALIGLDNNAYQDCSRLVRNICLMEGAWSQLYMVLLIGRVMSGEGDTTEALPSRAGASAPPESASGEAIDSGHPTES